MSVRCVGRIGHVSFPEIRWPERSVRELCATLGQHHQRMTTLKLAAQSARLSSYANNILNQLIS